VVALRRSLVLLLMTLVLPGSAQLVAGNRRVGRVVLRTWGCLVLVAALVWWRVDLDSLARLAVNPWFLGLVRYGGLVVGVGWALLLLDAWRLGRPPRLRRGHRVLTLVLALALAAGVLVPFRTASRMAQAQHDLVASVFPSGAAAATTGGRLNVLLLGGDAGTGRVGVRPDSITLVSIDTLSGRATMISLPRNLQKPRFPAGTPAAAEFPNGFKGDGDVSNWLLNATYTYGADHPDLFPGPAGPGIEAVKQAVSGTLDQPVHYYVLVNLDGFQGIVDALGGLTIRVEKPIPIGQTGRVVEPGLRTLSGYETLWYARSRGGSSDYVRMGRQRCVLNGILRQADPMTVVRRFDKLALSAKSVVTTDIPQSQLPELVSLALAAKDQPLSSVQFVPPLVTPADPDIELMREKTAQAIERTGEPSGSAQAGGGVGAAPAAAGSGTATTGDSSTGVAPSGGDPAHTTTEADDVATVCQYS
jgi:LCP family protein required for cell wall assembly